MNGLLITLLEDVAYSTANNTVIIAINIIKKSKPKKLWVVLTFSLSNKYNIKFCMELAKINIDAIRIVIFSGLFNL